MKSLLPIRRKSSYTILCFVLIILLIISIIVATFCGSVMIEPRMTCQILINHLTGHQFFTPTGNLGINNIIWTIRFPRVLTAFFVGAGLTVSGILMQTLTKNSLADPYILGISSGASTGAVLVIMLNWFSFLGAFSTVFGALLGALLAIVIAIKVASSGYTITSSQLVLAGIAVSTLFTAITNFLIYCTPTDDDKVRTALYWMMGSLSNATWGTTGALGAVALLCICLTFLFTNMLDVLMLGDNTAITLGVSLTQAKLIIIAICSVLTGTIVAESGVIGFVGLIIPHITRGIVGPKHRRLLPAAALLGGIFVVLCDLLARTIFSPQELPLGVFTAMFGAPFFLLIIHERQERLGGGD